MSEWNVSGRGFDSPRLHHFVKRQPVSRQIFSGKTVFLFSPLVFRWLAPISHLFKVSLRTSLLFCLSSSVCLQIRWHRQSRHDSAPTPPVTYPGGISLYQHVFVPTWTQVVLCLAWVYSMDVGSHSQKPCRQCMKSVIDRFSSAGFGSQITVDIANGFSMFSRCGLCARGLCLFISGLTSTVCLHTGWNAFGNSRKTKWMNGLRPVEQAG